MHLIHVLVSDALAIMRGRPRSEEGTFNTTYTNLYQITRLAVQAIMRGRPKSKECTFNTHTSP